MAEPRFPGPEIELGGARYVLPKLSFGGFERAKDRIRDIAEGQIADPVELQNAVADVILGALRRNYPELDRAVLLDALDWDEAQRLFHLVLQISIPAPPPGELKAGSPSGASTGQQPLPT